MKARVKATGEIVEVAYLSEDKYGNKYYNVTTDTRTYRETELEMMSDKGDYFYTYDYWEKLKHQYAGMAMQTILEKSHNEDYYTNLLASWSKCGTEEVARLSVIYATALVDKLKSESNG